MGSSMDLYFGLVGIACGAYCLFWAVKMKTTGEICKTLLLDKETAKKPCKNVGEYLMMVIPPTFVLGIVLMAYGIITLIDSYVVSCFGVMIAFLVISFVVLVWYGSVTTKAKRKYF